MIVFRLILERYGSALSGKGAKIAGGRWNSAGIEMIYTSESRSLSTAEVAVNLDMGKLPSGYEMVSIFIPDDIAITMIPAENLPENWKKFPFYNFTQDIGDQFILQNLYAVMKVPSAVVKGDFNYLINPRHPDFERIEIVKKEPYEFDERFYKR